MLLVLVSVVEVEVFVNVTTVVLSVVVSVPLVDVVVFVIDVDVTVVYVVLVVAVVVVVFVNVDVAHSETTTANELVTDSVTVRDGYRDISLHDDLGHLVQRKLFDGYFAPFRSLNSSFSTCMLTEKVSHSRPAQCR